MKVNGAKFIISFFIVIGMIYIVGFWGTSVEKVSYASAYMYAQDRHFIGTVNFSEKADGVEIVIDCNNIPPGSHGLHIHEYGNCSDNQFECAGGHFNPTNQQHGSLTSEQRHLGDLGNVEASEQGTLT
ncbi:MAG: superoxide dismutase family protein, partial [Candidatus Babeliales bacterium]